MNAFVVVGNIQRFDITKHFERNDTVIWKQVSNGQVGDEVYIYLGRPLSRLVYKCRIVQKDVNGDGVGYLSQYGEKKKPSYMKLELISELPSEGLALKQLLSKGLKTVQCATKMDAALKLYVEEVTK